MYKFINTFFLFFLDIDSACVRMYTNFYVSINLCMCIPMLFASKHVFALHEV